MRRSCRWDLDLRDWLHQFDNVKFQGSLHGLRENQGSKKHETQDCQLCGSADSDAVPLRIPTREKFETNGNALHVDRFGPIDRPGPVDGVDPVDLIHPGWGVEVFGLGTGATFRRGSAGFMFRIGGTISAGRAYRVPESDETELPIKGRLQSFGLGVTCTEVQFKDRVRVLTGLACKRIRHWIAANIPEGESLFLFFQRKIAAAQEAAKTAFRHGSNYALALRSRRAPQVCNSQFRGP